MKRDKILFYAQEICDSLITGGVLDNPITITEDTVLIGAGTQFDSISFVTFFMELEDKINEVVSKEIYLVLDEIQEFDSDSSFLTMKVLADYIQSIL